MSGVCQERPNTNFFKALRSATFIEEGVITALFAVSLSALAALLGALFWGVEWLVTQEKLVAAVDLSALAAADTQRGLVSGIVCENAESILKTVDAVMTTCRIVGDGVMVSGQLSLPPMTLEASAIAGEK